MGEGNIKTNGKDWCPSHLRPGLKPNSGMKGNFKAICLFSLIRGWESFPKGCIQKRCSVWKERRSYKESFSNDSSGSRWNWPDPMELKSLRNAVVYFWFLSSCPWDLSPYNLQPHHTPKLKTSQLLLCVPISSQALTFSPPTKAWKLGIITNLIHSFIINIHFGNMPYV